MVASKRKWKLLAILILVAASVGCMIFFSITRSYRYVMLRHFSEMPYFASARRVARIVKPGQMQEITLSPRFGGSGFELKGRSYVLHAPKTPKGNPKIVWGIQHFVDGEPTGPIKHFANWAPPERFASFHAGSRYWLLDVAVEENRFADERIDDSILYYRSMTLNNPISNLAQSHYRVKPPSVPNTAPKHVIYMVSGTGLLPNDINIDEDIPVLVRFDGYGADLSDRNPLVIASRARSAYVVMVRLCFELPADWVPRKNRFLPTITAKGDSQESPIKSQIHAHNDN